ncbi:MAG: low specificity L-threonine aldolase, partial [Rhodospirillaceae bacterium]|nr:low specificity L-threonine aldolase [Rhodospirillaceae bacterium]
VGILAAACLYALHHNIDRLAEDHAKAETLAKGLRGIPNLRRITQATNMVFADVPPPRVQALQKYLQEKGILAAVEPTTRFVLHLDVSAADVSRVVSVLAAFFKG